MDCWGRGRETERETVRDSENENIEIWREVQ